MLVALIVNRAGQADFTRLCWDGEETAGIDEETVAYQFLLEGYSRCDQEAGETEGKYITDWMWSTVWDTEQSARVWKEDGLSNMKLSRSLVRKTTSCPPSH